MTMCVPIFAPTFMYLNAHRVFPKVARKSTRRGLQVLTVVVLTVENLMQIWWKVLRKILQALWQTISWTIQWRCENVVNQPFYDANANESICSANWAMGSVANQQVDLVSWLIGRVIYGNSLKICETLAEVRS